MPVIQIPAEQITDWSTFHDVFAATLGFPAFYGRNMNACDCLSRVAASDAGMTRIVVGAGDVLTLQIDDVATFAARCPEQYEALIECVAFVNWRRLDIGERAIRALASHRTLARAPGAPQPPDARPDTA